MPEFFDRDLDLDSGLEELRRLMEVRGAPWVWKGVGAARVGTGSSGVNGRGLAPECLESAPGEWSF